MGVEVVYEALASFFDGYFLAILIATGVLFLIMFVTWWVYRTISKRDIFQLHQKHGGMTYATNWDWAIYILKFFFLFPLITFAGFLIFAFSLFILMKPTGKQEEVILLFLAIVMVSTIRVGAYVSEHMAEDFAKLVPLSMLAILLANPGIDRIGISWEQMNAFATLIPAFLKYFVFIIMLEAVLRGFSWLFRNMRSDDDASPSDE
jgi:hypothetical protein